MDGDSADGRARLVGGEALPGQLGVARHGQSDGGGGAALRPHQANERQVVRAAWQPPKAHFAHAHDVSADRPDAPTKVLLISLFYACRLDDYFLSNTFTHCIHAISNSLHEHYYVFLHIAHCMFTIIFAWSKSIVH